MDFLIFLEGIRNPILDAVMLAVTNLGGETCFMAIALIFFWCINKKHGYYILAIAFSGTIFNQFLKLLFRIPRPWIQNPDLSVVEGAIEEATGYSFPSGHTQNSVGTFLGIAAVSTRKWIRALCISLIILVPFSRMYLGVHTVYDVAVSFAAAVILVAVFYRLFIKDPVSGKKFWTIISVLLICSVCLLLFTTLYSFPPDIDIKNLNSGVKNANLLLGSILGLVAVYYFDSKYLNFDVKAVWWVQIIKSILGLALVVGVKAVLKAPLIALFNGSQLSNAVRYFIIVIVAGIIYPMSFKYLSKLGKVEKSPLK